jgi:hypothetical protein
MLTQAQKTLLKTASKSDSKERSKEIDRTIELVQAINPAAFHHYVNNEPDSRMKARVFFDEPVSIKADHYSEYVVQYNQNTQHDSFKRRSEKLLKS